MSTRTKNRSSVKYVNGVLFARETPVLIGMHVIWPALNQSNTDVPDTLAGRNFVQSAVSKSMRTFTKTLADTVAMSVSRVLHLDSNFSVTKKKTALFKSYCLS